MEYIKIYKFVSALKIIWSGSQVSIQNKVWGLKYFLVLMNTSRLNKIKLQKVSKAFLNYFTLQNLFKSMSKHDENCNYLLTD